MRYVLRIAYDLLTPEAGPEHLPGRPPSGTTFVSHHEAVGFALLGATATFVRSMASMRAMAESDVPVHPGEILLELLDEFELSASELAAELRVPGNRISELVRGNRAMTADTALRLGRFFDRTPEYWMNLQRTHDLAVAERAIGAALQCIRPASMLEGESGWLTESRRGRPVRHGQQGLR